MRTRTQQALAVTVAAAALMAVIALPTDASAISVITTSGVWTDTNPNVSGVGTSTISWGISTGSGQSQYIYTAAGTPIPVTINTPFNLGSFTHNNRPILGTSLSTAELTVNSALDISGDNVADLTLASVFDFEHEETDNDFPCAYGATNGPCNDKVTFTLNTGKTTSTVINGIEYVLTITGFVVGGNLVTDFITAENASNVAGLQGNLVSKDSVVPLPAALPMFLSALTGLGLIARRKA